MQSASLTRAVWLCDKCAEANAVGGPTCPPLNSSGAASPRSIYKQLRQILFWLCAYGYTPSKVPSVLYPLVVLPARPVAHRADSETLTVLVKGPGRPLAGGANSWRWLYQHITFAESRRTKVFGEDSAPHTGRTLHGHIVTLVI